MTAADPPPNPAPPRRDHALPRDTDTSPPRRDHALPRDTDTDTAPNADSSHGAEPKAMADTVLVDATGLRCPLPVIRLAQAARAQPPGTVITLLSTDPAAEPDVAAWCRMRGAELLSQQWLPTGTLQTQIQTPS